MRVDQNGRVLRQVTVWLPVEVIQLLRADGLNLSGFVRTQLEILYGVEVETGARVQRDRLLDAARQTFELQRRLAAEAEADREQARAVVRELRAERDAAALRKEEVLDALLQVVGDGPADRYRRMLPENDRDGDLVDDWEALVRRVSRLCGAEIDSAEVAAELRRMTVET